MALALRRCRDAEIIWEQRTEVDLATPENVRQYDGWGVRINLEGKLGWAFSDISTPPESLLELAIQAARNSNQEGILFSHGLPFTGKAPPPEPFDVTPHLNKLSLLVDRISFLVPSLLPNREISIKAGLRHHKLTLLTRAGEQAGDRTTFHLVLTSQEAPHLAPYLTAGILLGRLRESPAEVLCRLAWQAAHSKQITDLEPGEYKALFTENATGALLRDLVEEHLNSASFLKEDEQLGAPWGEPWLSPQITVYDDATLPSGPGHVPFDAEGITRKPVTLIRKGIVHHHLADRIHARKLGVDAPGLAVRDWGSPPRPGWSNLIMEPGESSITQLAKTLDEGIILDELVPCQAPRKPGEFCRLAKIAFTLKNGRPHQRIAPLLVKGNFTKLLGEDLCGIGTQRTWNGRCFTPALGVFKLILEKPKEYKELEETHGLWW